ncbi:hypothetical protein M8494_29390 [Serratia ureilytica]
MLIAAALKKNNDEKNLLSLCLSLALTVGAPLAANADTPASVSVAPASRHAAKPAVAAAAAAGVLRVKLDAVSPQLNRGEIRGRSPPIRCRPIAVRWK